MAALSPFSGFQQHVECPLSKDLVGPEVTVKALRAAYLGIGNSTSRERQKPARVKQIYLSKKFYKFSRTTE